MRPITPLAAAAAALSLLAGCEQPPRPTPPGAAGGPASRPPPELTTASAFALAFPAGATITAPDGDGGSRRLTYAPGQLIEIGGRKALVSLGTSDDDCHICTGAMAVHYLSARDGVWRLEAGWPAITSGKGFGQPPDVGVRRDLGPHPVLVAEAGVTAQGYTCVIADLVELGPEAPQVLLEDVVIHADNRGVVGDEGPVEETDATLRAGPDDGLIADYEGSPSGRATYARRDGKLVRTSGPETLDAC